MKTSLIAALIYILFSFSSFSQGFSIGIAAGDNITYTRIKSSKEFRNKPRYSPGLGYSFAVLAKKEISAKSMVILGIHYDRRRDKDNSETALVNDMGQPLGDFPIRRTVNQYLKGELGIAYKLTDRFAIGTGLNIYYLLSSKNKLGDGGHFDRLDNLKNYHYRKLNFNIPIFASYSIHRFLLRAILDKGLFNRMKDRSGYIKEIENTFTFQCAYFFPSK